MIEQETPKTRRCEKDPAGVGNIQRIRLKRARGFLAEEMAAKMAFVAGDSYCAYIRCLSPARRDHWKFVVPVAA